MSSFIYCLLGLVFVSTFSGIHSRRILNEDETPAERFGFLNVIKTIGKLALPVAQKLLSDGDLDAGTAMMILKNDADVVAHAIKDKEIQVRLDFRPLLNIISHLPFRKNDVVHDEDGDEDIQQRINFLSLLKKGAQFALPIAQKLLSDGDVDAYRALTTFKNDADTVTNALKDKEIQVRFDWKGALKTGWNIVKKVAPVVAPIVGSLLDADNDVVFDGDVQQRAFIGSLLKTVAKYAIPVIQNLVSDEDYDGSTAVTRFAHQADVLGNTLSDEDVQQRKGTFFDHDQDADLDPAFNSMTPVQQRAFFGDLLKTIGKFVGPLVSNLVSDGDITTASALVGLKNDADVLSERCNKQ